MEIIHAKVTKNKKYIITEKISKKENQKENLFEDDVLIPLLGGSKITGTGQGEGKKKIELDMAHYKFGTKSQSPPCNQAVYKDSGKWSDLYTI